jgi:hypothetical protein
MAKSKQSAFAHCKACHKYSLLYINKCRSIIWKILSWWDIKKNHEFLVMIGF